jgi:hypothetical protein
MLKNAIATMLLVLVALTGIGMAANPPAMTISACGENNSGILTSDTREGLLFYPYNTEFHSVETPASAQVLLTNDAPGRIYANEDGSFYYVGPNPSKKVKTTLYYTIRNPSGYLHNHSATIYVEPCSKTITCDYDEYISPGATCFVSMTTPLVIGESIDANIHTDGNGVFNTVITYGGVDNNGDPWNGVYPVVIELWEDDENGLGFQLNASATLNCYEG